MIDFRLGRYQGVLQDVECDALICDPPYSKRTHEGRRTGSELRVAGIKYQFITEQDAHDIAEFWSKRSRFWAIIFGDHITRKWHSEAWEAAGWYVFGPVRWIKPNAPPRMSGDGPTVSTEEILVARRKMQLPGERTGSRPGHYICNTETGGNINEVTGESHPGRKPVKLMQALVRDYSLPHDLIADSHVGTATTLLAAQSQGRRSVGSEMDADTYKKAQDRIDAGITADMFAS